MYCLMSEILRTCAYQGVRFVNFRKFLRTYINDAKPLNLIIVTTLVVTKLVSQNSISQGLLLSKFCGYSPTGYKFYEK